MSVFVQEFCVNPIINWFKNTSKAVKAACAVVAAIILIDLVCWGFLAGKKSKPSVFLEAQGGLTARVTIRAGAKAGLSDLMVLSGKAIT